MYSLLDRFILFWGGDKGCSKDREPVSCKLGFRKSNTRDGGSGSTAALVDVVVVVVVSAGVVEPSRLAVSCAVIDATRDLALANLCKFKISNASC